MFKKFAFTVALLLAAVSSSDAFSAGANEVVNIRVDAGVGRRDTLMHHGASYISVRFSDFNLPPGDEVLVRSPDGKTVYRYTGKGRNDAGSFVSSYIPGDKAVVEYISTNKGPFDSNGYTIPGFARGFANGVEAGEKYATCSADPRFADQTLPAKCFKKGTPSQDLPEAYNKARAVARLLVNGTEVCSAWLAGSEGHLITNNNCVKGPEQAMVTDVEFDTESASCSDEVKVPMGQKGKIVTSNPTFITTDRSVDYTLLKLPADVDVSKYGYLQFRGVGPRVGEQIYIPQHPMGYAKRIGYQQENGKKGLIASTDDNVECGDNQVGYSIHTYGTYGAPVLGSEDNLVVALDHCVCSGYGVHPSDVLSDLAQKNIVIKDLIVGYLV